MDQHVIKMTLESLQLLYTASRYLQYSAFFLNRSLVETVYSIKRFEEANPGVEINYRGRVTTYRQEKVKFHKYVNKVRKLIAYKATHVSHPSCMWVKAHVKNFLWLMTHFAFLCEEYEARFKKEHACKKHLNNLEAMLRASTRYVTDHTTNNTIIDTVHGKICVWIDNHPGALTAESLYTLWEEMTENWKVEFDYPLVVGQIFREVEFPGAPDDKTCFREVDKVTNAYKSYYLYKLDTMKRVSFRNPQSKSYWDNLQNISKKASNKVYVVTQDGVLHNVVRPLGMTHSKVAVLQQIVGSDKTYVKEFYHSVRDFVVQSPLARTLSEALKGEKDDPFVEALKMKNSFGMKGFVEVFEQLREDIPHIETRPAATAFARRPVDPEILLPLGNVVNGINPPFGIGNVVNTAVDGWVPAAVRRARPTNEEYNVRGTLVDLTIYPLAEDTGLGERGLRLLTFTATVKVDPLSTALDGFRDLNHMNLINNPQQVTRTAAGDITLLNVAMQAPDRRMHREVRFNFHGLDPLTAVRRGIAVELSQAIYHNIQRIWPINGVFGDMVLRDLENAFTMWIEA